jgi:hypothetical protein
VGRLITTATGRHCLRGCAALAAGVVWCMAMICQAQTPEPVAPVAATYLYVEPYQARVEALFGADLFLQWTGEKTDFAAPLTPEEQKVILKRAGAKAEGWCRLREDGTASRGKLATVSFVQGKPGQTEPLKEGESITPKDCMIGLVWEFPTSPSPQLIEVQWWEWNHPVTTLPMKVFAGPHIDLLTMTSALPSAKWQNEGRLPPPKPLAAVPMLPPVTYLPVPVASLVWLVIGYAYYVLRSRTGKKPRGGWLGMMIAWIFVAAILSPMGVMHVRNPTDKVAAPVRTTEDATRIAEPLLRNIYRAFDYQTESQIYDSLSRSVDGELLRKLYLDTMQSLSIEGREGARVKVTDMDVQIDKVTQGENLAFTAEGQWTALGTVGHWGHTHTRVNRYNARVTIHPVDTEWKITALEVLELRRL